MSCSVHTVAIETVMSETPLFPHQTTSTSSPETLDTVTTRSTQRLDGMKVDNIKPLVDSFVIPDLHRVFVPASGRLLNWGAPLASFLLIDVFFSNQVLAQYDLFRCWKETKACKTDLYLLPLSPLAV